MSRDNYLGEQLKIPKKKRLSGLNLAISKDITSPNKLQASYSLLSLSPYAIKDNLSFKALNQSRVIKKRNPNRTSTFNKKAPQNAGYEESKSNINKSLTLSPDTSLKIQYCAGEILSSKLNSMLKGLKEISPEEKLKIVQSIFTEVIERDRDYEIILERIKSEFNDFIHIQSLELQKSMKAVQESETIKSLMSDEMERLFKENNDISAKYKEIRTRYTELYDKFLKITEVDLDKIDQSPENWNLIIQENKMLNQALEKSSLTITRYKNKEKKMMKLIMAMKDKGYPIEEIYDEIKVEKKPPNYECNEDLPDDTDAENLVSPKPTNFIRPFAVPPLSMTEVEPNSFSSDDSLDQQESNSEDC